MAADNGNRLKVGYVPVDRVSVRDMNAMYGIYEKYYQKVSLELFAKDMSEKSGVLMVRRRKDNTVVGFSTLKTLTMELKGRTVTGVFSGDTVLEEQYWGNQSLQVAFFFWVLKEKLKHPLRPVFWLLISKGYKTYLLLSNNFKRYYPNPDGEHAYLAHYVDAYCGELFPSSYCSQKRLLDFGEEYSALRDEVAPISEDMKARHKAIKYFEEMNPTWQRGTELPCIGVIDFITLAAYPVRIWRKHRREKPASRSTVCE